MAFKNLFSSESPTQTTPPPQLDPNQAETETVRRIIQALNEVAPDRRRFLAGFAYVLTRAAYADLDISNDEAAVMEQIVSQIGGLPESHAVLVVEIARSQSELFSGTEDYVVTREFNNVATDDERKAAVAACFAVAATDHEITAEEYKELTEIAEELGLSRPELNEIRAQYRDQLTAIKKMREAQAG
jgi:tellurite resistance protein